MHIEIREAAFDALDELQRYQQNEVSQTFSGKYGAMCNFIGSMRDINEGAAVESMSLEHYPEMTQKVLTEICDVAMLHWDLLDILLIHRVGDIHIDDNIVLIGVWSMHRGDAFEACRYLIETLKARAPFWKQETTAEGARWVEKNTPS